MFSFKWAMSLNWTVKGHDELNVELHYGEADELRHRHHFGHPDIPSEVKTENMVDWRSFAVTFLLHAWIVPKFVCSQHKCLGGFDIYFILDRWAICSVERFNQSGKKRTFPISHTVLLCLVLSAQKRVNYYQKKKKMSVVIKGCACKAEAFYPLKRQVHPTCWSFLVARQKWDKDN